MTNRWAILSVLFVARTAMAFQFQAAASLSPLVIDRFDTSLAQIGMLIGLYLAPGVVIAMPGGAIAARFGDRRMVLAGLALMLTGGILMWQADTWNVLTAGRVVAGIGGVILNVLMTKMVTDWFAGREISTAMSIFINSWPVGIALALVTLPVLVASGDLAAGWLMVLAVVTLAALLFLTGYRDPPGAPQATQSALVARPAFPIRAVIAAGLVWALYNCAMAMVFSFGPAVLQQRGWDLPPASAMTSLMIWLIAVTIPIGGILADRTGRRDLVIAASLAAVGLLLALVPLVPQSALVAVFVLIGLAIGLPAGPIMTLPADVLAPSTRAAGMGLFFTIYYAAFMVTPAIAGWLADLTGNVAVTFGAGASLVAGALISLGWFLRLSRKGRAAKI